MARQLCDVDSLHFQLIQSYLLRWKTLNMNPSTRRVVAFPKVVIGIKWRFSLNFTLQFNNTQWVSYTHEIARQETQFIAAFQHEFKVLHIRQITYCSNSNFCYFLHFFLNNRILKCQQNVKHNYSSIILFTFLHYYLLNISQLNIGLCSQQLNSKGNLQF